MGNTSSGYSQSRTRKSSLWKAACPELLWASLADKNIQEKTEGFGSVEEQIGDGEALKVTDTLSMLRELNIHCKTFIIVLICFSDNKW